MDAGADGARADGVRADGAPGPWYRDGLRFSCHRCGNCCVGQGSVVVVNDREVEALARSRGMTVAAFRAAHTRDSFGDTVLVDRADGSCEWLERGADGKTSCRVHDAKPDQCRSYPFWPRVLRSPESWRAEGAKCRGIAEADGPPIPADEIDRKTGKADALEALDLLLEELDAEVPELGATCWLSGDCCDFPKAGHRLFATRLEAERFARGVDLRGFDASKGLCPAWKGGRCTAREHRPSACRVYFCDPNAAEKVNDLGERTVTRLRWLHERHGLPWDYREWTSHLAELAPPAAPGDPIPDTADSRG
ncbi:MAG: hypothetical protein HMLKMBBP_03662 [Planctomycetes bacterium]|nr:hypothetical protein [Planctomycetota bacterium]